MLTADECKGGRSLLMFKGKLVVIGAKSELHGSISTVQYYDFNVGSWSKAKDMDVPRSHHAAAVIPGPFTHYNIFNL